MEEGDFKLLAETSKNMENIERLQAANEKLSVLTNNTQNIYYDTFKYYNRLCVTVHSR